MRRADTIPAAVAALLTLSVSACGAAGSPEPAADSASNPKANGGAPAKEISAADYDRAKFNHSTDIDNEWFPLRPGTQFVYAGSSTEEGQLLAHRVVFTVTDLTKVIDGVRSVVVWDRDYTEGTLVETELALFAQDDDGNIWHFGQYPEEYDNGEFDKAPAWIHGLEGAKAGITIKAKPRLGTPDYAQGFAPPPINWIDRARVYQTGQRTCVPTGCYDNVLVTEEFERNKPEAFQLKYYAPGVGNVRVGWRGAKEEENETLELVRVVHLERQQLADVRAGALALEERAYRVSKDVYARTPRAERAG